MNPTVSVPSDRRRFCDRPYRHLRIGSMGEGQVCCTAWTSAEARVGRIGPGRSLEDVWYGARARAFRSSILDGSFRFCKPERCPVLDSLPLASEVADPEMLDVIERGLTRAPPPEIVALNYDDSCTLSCPQCRVERILHSGERLEKLETLQDSLLEQLEDPGELIITGSGDALASPVYRRFLHAFDEQRFPNTVLHLRTNADILTDKMWDYIRASHGRIRTLDVSIDSATAETYEVVRRGGSFSRTLANMAAMGERRRAGGFDTLRVNFCVQKRNFREAPEFVALARSWSATQVVFQALHPAGELVGERYLEHAVHLPGHPEHAELLEVLRDERLRDPSVRMHGPLRRLTPLEIRELDERDQVPFDA